MTIEELSEIIRQKFQEGKRRSEIKEELLQFGYYEEDIDAAMEQIQHDAIKQLPGISSFYRVLEEFEARTNLTTAKMSALVMILSVGILLLLAAGFYFIFDPLGTRAEARDAERSSDAARIQTALGYYYQQHAAYPDNLDNLVPTFLVILPRDPQSEASYSYKSFDGATNYQLCIKYETQPSQCVNASASSSQIPIVPTATPIPVYVPQGASSPSAGVSQAPSVSTKRGESN